MPRNEISARETQAMTLEFCPVDERILGAAPGFNPFFLNFLRRLRLGLAGARLGVTGSGKVRGWAGSGRARVAALAQGRGWSWILGRNSYAL
jgi:hypothetical protein